MFLCQEHKAALSGLQPSPGSDLGNEGTLGWGAPPFYLLSLQLWGDQQGPGAHTHLSILHEDTQDGASRARAALARLTRSTFCGASLKVPRRLPLLRALLTCSHSSLKWAKPGVKEALEPKMTGNRSTHIGSCGASKRNQQFSTT